MNVQPYKHNCKRVRFRPRLIRGGGEALLPSRRLCDAISIDAVPRYAPLAVTSLGNTLFILSIQQNQNPPLPILETASKATGTVAHRVFETINTFKNKVLNSFLGFIKHDELAARETVVSLPAQRLH